jgi:hypothetical protein
MLTVKKVTELRNIGAFTVAYPGILFGGGGSSTNLVEDTGQREQGSGGSSPIVRGFAHFANEGNPCSY